MFDYKSEALAWSITAENAEMRGSLLKQELLATLITLENLRVVTPKMILAGHEAETAWSDAETAYSSHEVIYKAMLEAA